MASSIQAAGDGRLMLPYCATGGPWIGMKIIGVETLQLEVFSIGTRYRDPGV